MATMLSRGILQAKRNTVSFSNPGTIVANSIAIYTDGLTVKNSVSIQSRVRELFNALRDGNFVSRQRVYVEDVYMTANVDGGIPVVLEGLYVALNPGDVRVGVAFNIRGTGSGILERMVRETSDWGNENNRLLDGT